MKQPCLTIYTLTEKKQVTQFDKYEPIVSEARQFVSLFYAQIKNFNFINHQTPWAFYDRFFVDIALPYSKYQTIFNDLSSATQLEGFLLPEDLENLIRAYAKYRNIPVIFQKQSYEKKIIIKNNFKNLILKLWSLFLVIYSLLSFIYLTLFRYKNWIPIWTGDYLGSTGRLDPRLGELEDKLLSAKYSILPFIRTTGVSWKKSFHNFLQRKCPCIYYEKINEWIYVKNPDVPYPKNAHFFMVVFFDFYYKEALNLQKQIKLWTVIFNYLSCKNFISWFLSNRTACLLWAAKNANYHTIGFMHGVSVLSYLGHEFMPEYNGSPIGPHIFGTWSNSWKNYFQKNASIYPENAIQVSGPLKKMQFENLDLPKKCKKIYIIAEAHLPVSEIIPYLEVLLKNASYELVFKIRPFGLDLFWQKFSHNEIYQKFHFNYSKEPTPNCFRTADLVIGTHSTAVLEALTLNKPILILNTRKWGDYFNLKEQYGDHCPIWVESAKDLEQKISSLFNNNNSHLIQDLLHKYFSQESGADWVLKNIKN